MESDNFIADGFYDYGHAGSDIKFATLPELQNSVLDNKREVLLVDSKKDVLFANFASWLAEAVQGKTAEEAISMIGNVVSTAMGGSVEKGQIANYPFKFRITELKLQMTSNVIPIGLVNKGTFYHRALLFKALCDRIGLAPCLLIRGEYNRAWNIVDLKKQVVAVAKPADAAPSEFIEKWETQMKMLNLAKTDTSPVEGAFIVDLMFNPGAVIPLESRDADLYQRIQ